MTPDIPATIERLRTLAKDCGPSGIWMTDAFRAALNPAVASAMLDVVAAAQEFLSRQHGARYSHTAMKQALSAFAAAAGGDHG